MYSLVLNSSNLTLSSPRRLNESHEEPHLDLGVLWLKLPVEVQDEILVEIHRGGDRNVLKHLRVVSQQLCALVTPLLFDRLILRRSQDVVLWSSRLDQHEVKAKKNVLEVFWLKDIRMLKIVSAASYPDTIGDFFRRISQYTFTKLSHIYVQDALYPWTQQSAQWVTDMIYKREIPRLTWDNSVIPSNILSFLDYSFAKSFILLNSRHFSVRNTGDFNKGIKTYLNADLELYEFEEGVTGWQRIERVLIKQLDEETIDLLRHCTRLTSLSVCVKYDLPYLSRYDIPVRLPNISRLRSLYLNVPDDGLPDTISLMTTNLRWAASLQDITFDLKLSWGSLCNINSHLRMLVQQATVHKPRNLAIFRIALHGYITISRDIYDHDPLSAKEMLGAVAYLEDVDRNPDFIRTEFFFPLGRRCSRDQFTKCLAFPKDRRTGERSDSLTTWPEESPEKIKSNGRILDAVV